MTEVNVHGKLPKRDTSENGKEVCTDDVEHTHGSLGPLNHDHSQRTANNAH